MLPPAEIGSGPFPDVVEATLARLLEGGLEDAAFRALQVHFLPFPPFFLSLFFFPLALVVELVLELGKVGQLVELVLE